MAGWHVTVLCRLGLRLLDVIAIESPGMRSGANGQLRLPAGMVFVFELDTSPWPALRGLAQSQPARHGVVS